MDLDVLHKQVQGLLSFKAAVEKTLDNLPAILSGAPLNEDAEKLLERVRASLSDGVAPVLAAVEQIGERLTAAEARLTAIEALSDRVAAIEAAVKKPFEEPAKDAAAAPGATQAVGQAAASATDDPASETTAA